jgi:hypothetical protein
VGIPALVDGQGMPDLGTAIYRQRLVIEGTCNSPTTDTAIRAYLVGLSKVWAMTILFDVYTCKAFNEESAVEYTRRAFGATRIVAKAF